MGWGFGVNEEESCGNAGGCIESQCQKSTANIPSVSSFYFVNLCRFSYNEISYSQSMIDGLSSHLYEADPRKASSHKMLMALPFSKPQQPCLIFYHPSSSILPVCDFTPVNYSLTKSITRFLFCSISFNKTPLLLCHPILRLLRG